MARKPTLTEKTNAESHAEFKDVVAALGQGVDPSTDCRHAVLVDSIPIADRQSEMRKPGTSFYEKSYSEANAVACLAVSLDFDRQGVVDVLRRDPPMPDAELTVDGATVAFVEQTMVMDQAAHRLTLDIERLNTAARDCQDAEVAVVFKAGMLNLRFCEIPLDYYDNGLPIDDVLDEIYALARTLDGDLRPIRPEASRFPLLAGLKTFGSYHVGGKTYNPVMSLVDHGRLPLFSKTLAEQIGKKRTAAAGYPSSCRPLWLLLNVDIHFGFNDYTRAARAVIAAEDLKEFDRVVVEQPHFPPIIVDLT